jgi:chromosome segregation protein
MRLKSLDVVGFKSFLEPTVISFATGVTAVVGPNGCGKSNVVDAIRWVLGEQAATRLRGKITEDLIFAGNDANPAAGMAEVSLMLEADDNCCLPEPYTALSELAVTRRVYRSGESEYLINKIPCRLKDITEFFMSAQIHSRGYALIEQGKIEEIIQSKPEELRTLVEEAAGLSLFKGRRDISERKLERVRENLDRLSDVIAEIERQLKYARTQARKAETYKLIKVELGELERLTAARRLLGQRAEFETHAAREQVLKGEIEAARARAAKLQSAVDEAATALQQDRDRLAQVSQELENLRISAAERTRTRGFLQRRLATIDEIEPNLAAKGDELKTRATAARAARAEQAARLARETNPEDGSEAALAELKAKHDAAAVSLDIVERRVEQIKDEISDLMGEASALRSRLGDHAGERAELEGRIAVIQTRAPELDAAIALARAGAERAETELVAHRQHVIAYETELASSSEREMEARTALEHQRTRLAAARDALTGAVARTERLALGSAGQRLQSILESLNGDGPSHPPSFLLDIIKAPAALEPALRAVLGERLSAVIVESSGFALRAVEILKETQKGRLSFVPESMVAGSHELIAAAGISGRLVDELAIEPRYAVVVDAMLGHVLLADDLPSAVAASNLSTNGHVFVTRDGDVVWPGEIISGGSTAEASVVGDQETASSVDEAQAELQRSELGHQAAHDQAARDRAARDQAQATLAEARRAVAEAEQANATTQMALARTAQQTELVGAQRQDAQARLAELGQLMPDMNVRMERLALDEQAARARLAEARGLQQAARTHAEKAGEAMLTIASQVQARKARLGALAEQLRHHSELAADLESQLDENEGAIARSHSERTEFLAELQTLEHQERAAQSRESVIASEVQRLRAACEACAAQLEDRRGALARARDEQGAVENEAVECSLKIERARTLSEELARSFAEKFQADFDSLSGELAAALDGRDAGEDDQRLAELRAKAERIGEVNLAAESEVKELEQRHGALTEQRTDLEAAVADLTQTIQKLNREARRRFAETFEGAAKNFAELFPKLMRGGKARLELTHPDDLLESGVNILVQPAGKKVKEIGLLSGGEKALSAMALVFSLFLLNPSPFCVLDEVDAPLDEFSVAAFTALIRELKNRSQFIVITHNQRTMQTADQIHGITMEQPGISRLISLKLAQAA